MLKNKNHVCNIDLNLKTLVSLVVTLDRDQYNHINVLHLANWFVMMLQYLFISKLLYISLSCVHITFYFYFFNILVKMIFFFLITSVLVSLE